MNMKRKKDPRTGASQKTCHILEQLGKHCCSSCTVYAALGMLLCGTSSAMFCPIFLVLLACPILVVLAGLRSPKQAGLPRRTLITVLMAECEWQVKLNLHNAYRDVHFWKLSILEEILI